MKIYLIRHGESLWNKEDKIQGHSDPSLSEEGKSQAKSLAGRFTKINIDRIYSSDLKRARETAEGILNTTGVELVVDERLREIRLGSWEGKTQAEVDELFSGAYTKWLKDPSSLYIEGGETREDFLSRVKRAVDDIISRSDHHKAICIVSHGGVIAAYLSHILKADFDQILFNMRLDNCGITTIASVNGKRVILGINDTMHLPEPEKVKGMF